MMRFWSNPVSNFEQGRRKGREEADAEITALKADLIIRARIVEALKIERQMLRMELSLHGLSITLSAPCTTHDPEYAHRCPVCGGVSLTGRPRD